MSKAAAIVEQTAEIFVSRAPPMVPSPFLTNTRLVGLTSGVAEGLWRHPLYVQTHSFRLSDMTGCYACDSCCQPPKLLNKILLDIMNIN
jgi:hypothetical protein